ncbi:hypothetical protein [Scytonema sp. NUACC21]
MLNIGDYAQHQMTGLVGQVIGYGHEILHGVYQTTLTVREIKEINKTNCDRSPILEDVYSAWIPAQGEQISAIVTPE